MTCWSKAFHFFSLHLSLKSFPSPLHPPNPCLPQIFAESPVTVRIFGKKHGFHIHSPQVFQEQVAFSVTSDITVEFQETERTHGSQEDS